MNWYQKQGRSFATLATSRLCPTSRKKDKSKSEATLLRTLKQCCSKREGFITTNMPLLEMMFRLFLANGNLPMTPTELAQQSGRPAELILRVMTGEQIYRGLRPIVEG
jgi:hypothetical protein